MLAATFSDSSSSANGFASAREIRPAAASSATSESLPGGSRIPNSSPPKPGDDRVGTHRVDQPRPELTEDRVAALVPERVVDLLEAVEIHQQQRDEATLFGRVPDRGRRSRRSGARGWRAR